MATAYNPGMFLMELSVILFDRVKIAVFSDEDNTDFQDKKEFSGSVFKQLEEAYEYLRLCNQNHAIVIAAALSLT